MRSREDSRRTRTRPVEVRAARPADAEVIAGLSALLDYPTTATELRQRLAGLDPAENAVLVAEEGDVVVGWIHVFRSHRLEEDVFAELGGLIVAPGYRGRGLGRLLMSHGERWARTHGCGKLRVRSHQKREAAHSFYDRVGYRTVKRQRVFDKDLGGGD